MTLPSQVLDAIVARLKSALEPTADQLAHATPRVHVRAIDDTAIADITDFTTVPMPAVLVTCVGMPAVARDFGPTTVDAQFVARCIATRSQSSASRGDVAMDLAAFIASVVDEEVWRDALGQPTTLSRATRLGARNVGSRELVTKGVSMWIVTWNQQIELTARDRDGILRALRKLHIAVEIPGGASPDAAGTVELQGWEPPP